MALSSVATRLPQSRRAQRRCAPRLPGLCLLAAVLPSVSGADNGNALTVTAGGRLKLDAIVSNRGPQRSASASYQLVPGAITLDNPHKRAEATVSARASRGWLLARANRFDATSYFEFDLFGTAAGNEHLGDAYSPRLRHGYGTVGDWLGGHTFTTFMNISAFPEINDDGIPGGVILARQPMLRYTFVGEHHEIALAAELSDTTFVRRNGRRARADAAEFPDLVAKYTRFNERGNWSAAFIARRLRIDRGRGIHADSATTFALSVSGRHALDTDNDIRFALSAGNALGRYLSSNASDDVALDANGDIERGDAAGGFVALRHWWNRRWRSNIVLGASWQADRGVATENRWLATLHTNLLWTVAGHGDASTDVGLEFIAAHRQRFDHSDGTLLRLQATLIRRF